MTNAILIAALFRCLPGRIKSLVIMLAVLIVGLVVGLVLTADDWIRAL